MTSTYAARLSSRRALTVRFFFFQPSHRVAGQERSTAGLCWANSIEDPHDVDEGSRPALKSGRMRPYKAWTWLDIGSQVRPQIRVRRINTRSWRRSSRPTLSTVKPIPAAFWASPVFGVRARLFDPGRSSITKAPFGELPTRRPGSFQ